MCGLFAVRCLVFVRRWLLDGVCCLFAMYCLLCVGCCWLCVVGLVIVVVVVFCRFLCFVVKCVVWCCMLVVSCSSFAVRGSLSDFAVYCLLLAVCCVLSNVRFFL